MRAAKYNYERQVAQDSATNTKQFWVSIRSKTTVKETITRLKNASREIAEKDTDNPGNEQSF